VPVPTDPAVHDGLFEQTKAYYRADDLFTAADKLDISEETFRRIVKQLERFDLSKTGDDIKGLAFEKFLGTTFRGELGQFFTPRPVVEFMVDLLNPKEGQLICDPASGSGGFLIRRFEHVRGQIVADVQTQKDAERARIEALKLPEEEEERQIEAAFSRLNHELLPSGDDNKPIDTRVGRLAWQCIYGTDAEPRAARTAKMNMIMHGDGHGGIHYHDGLLDINGIFDGRFDLVLTNPPFGSNVGKDQKVGGSDETRVPTDAAYLQRCQDRGYGTPWQESHNRLLQAATSKTPILDLFEIGKGKNNRPTELIFVERCLNLLKPGGRMGIVLPDGNRPENRLLHAALRQVLVWTASQAHSQLARELCFVFADVPASDQPALDFQRMRLDRGMGYYADALAWARLILQDESPLTGAGGHYAPSLLFPMEAVFEAFVAKHLARQLAQSFTLKTQARSFSLVTHRGQDWFRLKPDLLVQASGANRLVLDTKWKLLDGRKATGADKYGLDQGDFYQLHAYGQSYLDGRGDVALIYPRTDAFSEALPVFGFPKSAGLRLWVLPFCLKDKRLLLPPCGSLDALFVRRDSSLASGCDAADVAPQDVALA